VARWDEAIHREKDSAEILEIISLPLGKPSYLIDDFGAMGFVEREAGFGKGVMFLRECERDAFEDMNPVVRQSLPEARPYVMMASCEFWMVHSFPSFLTLYFDKKLISIDKIISLISAFV